MSVSEASTQNRHTSAPLKRQKDAWDSQKIDARTICAPRCTYVTPGGKAGMLYSPHSVQHLRLLLLVLLLRLLLLVLLLRLLLAHMQNRETGKLASHRCNDRWEANSSAWVCEGMGRKEAKPVRVSGRENKWPLEPLGYMDHTLNDLNLHGRGFTWCLPHVSPPIH